MHTHDNNTHTAPDAPNNSAADVDRLDSPRETRRLLADISEATLWRMVRRGDIGPPIRISPGRVGFRHRATVAYIQRRAAGQ